jgi:small subunit ribosomal protein S6
LRYYELMMVVAPEIDEEGISATLERVNHYVSERGGSVVRQERWGRLRRLAYPIKHYNEGNYVLTHLEMEPQDTKDLEASLMVSEDVLRHLLVKVDAIPEAKVEQPQATTATAETREVVSPETPQVEEGALQETSIAVATDELAPPDEAPVTTVEDEPTSPIEAQVTTALATPEIPTSDQEPQRRKRRVASHPAA